MFDPKQHNFCSEFYVVEKSIEVVVEIGGETKRVRIDALKNVRNCHYSTSAYVEENITVQPTYPKNRSPKDMSVWGTYDLPWTNQDSADAALQQALGFLSERCSS